MLLWATAGAGAQALAACHGSPAVTQDVPDAQTAPKIPCAKDGAALAAVCSLTRASSDRGELWTIRFPDGGFRRLLVANGEVGAADGAEPLRADGDDVTIAGERYRLPDE